VWCNRLHSAEEKSLELEALSLRDLTGDLAAGQVWIGNSEHLASGKREADQRGGGYAVLLLLLLLRVLLAAIAWCCPRSDACTAS